MKPTATVAAEKQQTTANAVNVQRTTDKVWWSVVEVFARGTVQQLTTDYGLRTNQEIFAEA
ncbi:MAG: hypothetical protein ACE10K_10485, partial [Rhodothermales bacterium]